MDLIIFRQIWTENESISASSKDDLKRIIIRDITLKVKIYFFFQYSSLLHLSPDHQGSLLFPLNFVSCPMFPIFPMAVKASRDPRDVAFCYNDIRI